MLAILANIKRKFAAIYYNMRCLTSRNPFQASKESLVTIFEEMKRRLVGDTELDLFLVS